MSNHLLRDRNIMVYLPIVYLKSQTNKIREDGCTAGLGLDWGHLIARTFGTGDWEAGKVR